MRREIPPERALSALNISVYNPKCGILSQFATFGGDVDIVPKQLKLKAFIYENSLDTPVFGLIRFPQKVLTESQSLRWNYSPLKKRPPSCRVAFSF